MIASGPATSPLRPAAIKPAMKAKAFNGSGMINQRRSMTAIASVSDSANAAPAKPSQPGATRSSPQHAPTPTAPISEALRESLLPRRRDRSLSDRSRRHCNWPRVDVEHRGQSQRLHLAAAHF